MARKKAKVKTKESDDENSLSSSFSDSSESLLSIPNSNGNGSEDGSDDSTHLEENDENVDSSNFDEIEPKLMGEREKERERENIAETFGFWVRLCTAAFDRMHHVHLFVELI